MLKNENVSKVYKMGEVDLTVIKDLSLSIDDGEFVAIVGPSGSGKSTVLNILGCLDKPTEGKVSVEDIDVTQLNRTELAHFRGENIGFIFQSFNLIPVLSVYENIEYPLIMIQNLPQAERHERIMQLLEDVDMLDQKDKFPDQLPGGQRQSVDIARALVTQPKIVFADEPTANLDSASAENLLDIMENLNKENISEILLSKGVELELKDEFLSILDTCEFARYSPSAGSSEMDELYQTSMDTITKLEKNIK